MADKSYDGKLHAALALSDGTVLEGEGFGSEGERAGEVVFNTSLVGYEESLTDPSYKGQILILTYPLIGNYGVRGKDFESDRIQVEGFVVREWCRAHSHRGSVNGVSSFLREHGVPGIAGVDTRFLTRKIREFGVMNGAIKVSSAPVEKEQVLHLARAQEDISERELIGSVSTAEPKFFDAGSERTIALIDCGVKMSIVRSLLKRRINVVLLPHNASPDDVESKGVDGILISNGPGDPCQAKSAIDLVRDLHLRYPMFGICLGHQIISLALGGRTYKLKFGHRGTNQPVKDLRTDKVYITSQNHGFAVDAGSLKGTDLEVSHINLNDNSVEGIFHRSLPIFGFQAHPEANPGPWDIDPWFDELATHLN